MDSTEAAIAQAQAKLIKDHGITVHALDQGHNIGITSLGGRGQFVVTPEQWILLKIVVESLIVPPKEVK